MNTLNEYEMNENITSEKLVQTGFINDNNYWKYRKNIYKGTILNILIPINSNKKNNEYSESSFLQPLSMFYTVLENSISQANSELDKIIDNYNKVMDDLVTQGVFKHKEKENIKVKKRNK